MKKFFIRNSCNGDSSKLLSAHDLISGAIAGGIAGGITTPLDVIKTYLQTQKRKSRSSSAFLSSSAEEFAPRIHHISYTGIFSTLRGVYRTSGLKGLFAGVGVRMVWTSSQSMLMFFLYEFFIDNAVYH